MIYKVLLVDDDSLVRIGLKSFFDWKGKGLRIVGEASDGRKALDQIAVLKPDIVITDMYMPPYDGLKFIQQAKQISPGAVFIVLSCHNDLNYVKESLRLGVLDYLLKSSIVDSNELDKVLARAFHELEDRKQKPATQPTGLDSISPSDLERMLASYAGGNEELFHVVRKLLQQANIDAASPELFLIAMIADNYSKLLSIFQSEHQLDYAIRNILNEIVAEHGGGIIFAAGEHTYYLLLHLTVKNSIITPKDKALSICERFRISIKNHFGSTCSVFADDGSDLEHLPEHYQKISEEISANKNLYYDVVVDLADRSPGNYTQTVPRNTTPGGPLDKVLAYIHENYRNQITLDELAAVCCFSKFHLCKKFKEKTRLSIINYILMVRIDKAKEMLIQNQYRVFEIAQMVGFSDTSYFNRIFKKMTGYTPKEFIEYNHLLQ